MCTAAENRTKKIKLFWQASFQPFHGKIYTEDGARCRFRTCDPYRVKVMLYH